MSSHEDNPVWQVQMPVKLTDEQTADLNGRLRPVFKGESDEDINDLLEYTVAMVSNQKTVNYVVQELNGMETPPETSRVLGKLIFEYIQELTGGAGTSTTTSTAQAETGMKTPVSAKEASGHGRVVSLKTP
jgi:hypothetical protein